MDQSKTQNQNATDSLKPYLGKFTGFESHQCQQSFRNSESAKNITHDSSVFFLLDLLPWKPKGTLEERRKEGVVSPHKSSPQPSVDPRRERSERRRGSEEGGGAKRARRGKRVFCSSQTTWAQAVKPPMKPLCDRRGCTRARFARPPRTRARWLRGQ